MTQDVEKKGKKENKNIAVTDVATYGRKKGLEGHINQDELMIPRAKLLQSNSPTIIKDKERKYAIGDIINSVTMERLPEEFVPIFRFTSAVRWNSRDTNDPNYDPAYEPGALIWRSDDLNDPKVVEETKWPADGRRPKATKFINVFSYFLGVPMPVIISFSNTSYATGKQLSSLMLFSAGGVVWDRKYRLSSHAEENDKGHFYVLDVSQAGVATPEEMKVAEAWYDAFRPQLKNLKVDEEEWS